MSDPGLLLIVRKGCHLCEEARATLSAVVGEGFAIADVDDDPALARFSDLVPAVIVGGRLVDHWRIDPARVRAAIGAAGTNAVGAGGGGS